MAKGKVRVRVRVKLVPAREDGERGGEQRADGGDEAEHCEAAVLVQCRV